MKAAIRGTEIYYDIAGMELAPQGKTFIKRPVLFLLHGGPGGDHLRYKQHSLELQDCAQLVFIDHRGCGRSKKTKIKDYTLENNIEDIEALRKHLGHEKICLLGTSYGGMVAQGYAIRYPHRVEKLILVVTAPSFHFMEKAQQNLHARGNAKQIAITQHLWNGTFKNHAHIMQFFALMEGMYSVTSSKKKSTIYSKSKTIWSHEALNHGFTGSLRQFNFIPTLKKITCPTLILAGQDDWICDPSQSRIMAKHIPRAQLKIFKHCGHALAVDAHKKYITSVSQFIRKGVKP